MADDDSAPRPTPLRAVLNEVTRFDSTAFSPIAGARVAVGVGAALVIGLAAGNAAAAASMAAGALLVGVPTVVGGRRIALPGLGLIAVSMALSTFVGSVTGDIGWLHTAILVPWCLAGGLLLALQNPYLSVGTQGIAAMIVFGRFAEPPLGALQLSAYVLAGGLLAIGVLGLTRPPLTSRVQRRALAQAITSVAALARAGAGRRNGVASAEALDDAEGLLGRDGGGYDLRGLLDVTRRSRLELLAIDGVLRRLARQAADQRPLTPGTGPAPAGPTSAATTRREADKLPDPEVVRAATDDALGAAGDAFDAIARSVATGRPVATAAFDEAVRTTRLRLHAAAGAGSATGALAVDGAAIDGYLAALAGQLRAAAELAAGPDPSHDRRPLALARRRRRHPRNRWRDGLDTVRSQASLRSPVGRHAVRLAVIVTLAEVLALHTPLARGYWVALTASVVLRPDFSATFSRGAARVTGTSLGVLLAGLLAVAVHPGGWTGVALIVVLCAAACASFQVSYVLFSGFLTGLVVLLVGVVSPGSLSTAFDRLLDTVIGGALALAGYALWPTWSKSAASGAFADLARAHRSYLGAVLRIVAGRPAAGADLRALARQARAARGKAEAAVARSQAEPEGRGADLARSQSILAAMSRVSLTTHALRSDIEDHRFERPVPEVASLADALDDALGTVADHLDAERPARSNRLVSPGAHRPWGAAGEGGDIAGHRGRMLPPLRRRYEDLTQGLGDQADADVLLAETDEIVDAVDTLGALVGIPSAAETG